MCHKGNQDGNEKIFWTEWKLKSNIFKNLGMSLKQYLGGIVALTKHYIRKKRKVLNQRLQLY